MSWDRVEGNWKHFTGKTREKWAQLTDDDMEKIGGKREKLVGKMQESYDIAKEEAEEQVREFKETLD